MTTDQMLNAFATFFVTIDPPGQIAIFLALTVGLSGEARRKIALFGTLLGIGIILLFMIIGAPLLELLGISLPAFRVAGGLLLFYTAFEMVFEKRQERREDQAQRALSTQEMRSIAVFPLAIPLIAGPGAISAAILLSSDFTTIAEYGALTGIVLSVGLILLVALLLANRLNDILGETTGMVITRLFGILLAALSVQFVADGMKQLLG
ncbi:MarC family protein [Ahrensia sp. R2A130]|uniref:MarC family protein n=1 Tax=Ahrensia sp. R2A130 TaxID=744979 RepID=UPI0001E0E05E|nr:MarC family protein [Ahrensia sp. R2A130]EFL90361.1 membrane protein [Ahrensia sp. R2A130]